MRSVVYVDMPRDHDVMVSFEHVLIRKGAHLSVRTSEDNIWVIDRKNIDMSIARLLPHWEEGHLVVSLLECSSCPKDVHYKYLDGFRLRFTFHPVSNDLCYICCVS